MRTLVIGCGTVACKMFSRRTVRTAISRLGVSSSPSKTGAPRRPTSCPAPSVTSVLPVSDQQLFEAVTALWPRASNVTQLKRSSRRRVPLGRRQCRAPAPSRRASAAWKHFTWLATRSFARWRRQAEPSWCSCAANEFCRLRGGVWGVCIACKALARPAPASRAHEPPRTIAMPPLRRIPGPLFPRHGGARTRTVWIYGKRFRWHHPSQSWPATTRRQSFSRQRSC